MSRPASMTASASVGEICPGLDHEFLLGGDLKNIANLRQNLAPGIDDLYAFRRILEMLDVVIGVEGGEPHDAAKAALHPPHPVDSIGVDAANRGIEDNPAKHLEALDVLSREPGAIGSRHDVVL
jgi:hypothetical protein